MAKNFSRHLDQPRKHYVSTRWAQGRVLLDSDFNEGARLLERHRRTALLDIVGPNATIDQGFSVGEPWPSTWIEEGPPDTTPRLRPGFVLASDTVQLGGNAVSIFPLTLRPGSTQLGGDQVALARSEHIAYQRDYLQMGAADVPPAVETGDFAHLYYLHAFEQHVGVREDDELDEPMLRGDAPSLRIRRTRRVEVFDGVQPEDTTCQLAFDRLLAERYTEAAGHRFNSATQELESTARLQIAFAPGESEDSCAPCDPEARRYLGRGNKTLLIMQSRVDRFVWTTEPQQLVRVRVTNLDQAATGVTVEMLDEPTREQELPLTNRVVELIPFGALLEGGDLPEEEQHPHARKVAAEIGAFGRVSGGYDRDSATFQLAGPDLASQLAPMVHEWDAAHPDAKTLGTPDDGTGAVAMYARLWHGAATDAEVELTCQSDPDAPPLGGTGVVPLFHQTGRAGDYWLAALRADEPTVVVPHELLLTETGVPPHGPRRLLAPLGTVRGTDLQVTHSSDCRPRIRRVTESNCVTVTVGDGVGSVGDFASIQEAIDSLPSQGGRITVRPGVYRETIRVRRRRNVTIEGCGESSVLETPVSSPTARLIDIADSEGVTLSGFRIHAVEQRALMARRVVDLNLSELFVFAALRPENDLDAERVIFGAANTGAPLLDFDTVSALQLFRCKLESAQRPAVVLTESELCTLEDLSARGGVEQGPQASEALIGVHHSALVKIRDCELTPHAQVGISVSGTRSQDVELIELRIDGRQHTFRGAIYEPRSTVDFEDGARLSIVRCQLTLDGTPSDHAVVVVHGEEVSLRSNRCFVESRALDPSDPNSTVGAWAWGGVQVRGDSFDVELRDNHIQGGVGHGITLGSVFWRPATSPLESPSGSPLINASRRQGPGRAQVVFDQVRLVLDQDIARGFTDVDGQDYLPLDEGPIESLTIVGNRIQGMQANGISALTVLGLAGDSGDFLEVRRALIEGNTVSGNLSYPGPGLPLAPPLLPLPASGMGSTIHVPVLPWGGIVLSSASEGIDIRDNEVRDNRGSNTELLPVSGVFVLTGDGISITGNRIMDNGDQAPRPRTVTDDQGNTTTVVDPLVPGVRVGVGVMLAGVGPSRHTNDLSPQLSGRRIPDAGGSSLRVVGNTVRQPEGRALHAVGTGPMYVGENFFASLGYHGANTGQDRFAVGDAVFLQNLGKPWESFGVTQEDLVQDGTDLSPFPYPPGEERGFVLYDAPQPTARYLLNTAAQSPRMFVGEGGALSFSNNQVVYDLDVKRLPVGRTTAPVGYFTAAILGLDQVSVTGNQFAMRVIRDSSLGSPNPPEPVIDELSGEFFSQVVVLGGMVNVHRNRCSSGLQVTRLSLLAYGELSTNVSLNQLTHEYLALLQYAGPGAPPLPSPPDLSQRTLRSDVHNLVLDPQLAVNSDFQESDLAVLRRNLERSFVRLLRRGLVA